MHSVDHLIELALQEDIGSGDITTDTLIDRDVWGRGTIIAKEKEPFVLAGLEVAEKVFRRLDPDFQWQPSFQDGDTVSEDKIVLAVNGKLRALLIGERTALNFLQRLSGIATNVRSYVDRLENKSVRIVDTRKTLPGWRSLEKYAVRVGGAHNHRFGLHDGVLIKDNHIAACGGISKAVERIRKSVPHLIRIEVEVTDLSGVQEAIATGADVIMLDNMEISQIKKAVEKISGKALIEVSGGITKEKLNQLTDIGVDIVSIGALTHAARSVDMSMRILNAE